MALVVGLLLTSPVPSEAGSTEPSLAIAAVTASTNEGAVTLIIVGNYDHMNVVRLGYPVTIVVTAGTTVARLGLDGSVTVAVGANPPGPHRCRSRFRLPKDSPPHDSRPARKS